MGLVVENKIKRFEAVKHGKAAGGYRLRGINTNISFVRSMTYEEEKQYVVKGNIGGVLS